MSGNPIFGSGRGTGAEQWFVRLRAPDCTEAERLEFERWKATDPDNAAGYTDVERLYERTLALRADPEVSRATQDALRRSERRVATQGRVTPHWFGRLSIAATGLAALVVAVVFLNQWHSPQAVAEVRYATRVGERLSIVLQDGSTMLLDTATAVVARVGPTERYVRLLTGQAQFQVVHSDQTPFTVDVGTSTIRDIGTQFTVRSDEGRVAVTVSEGSVEVSDLSARDGFRHAEILAAGERLEYSEGDPQWIKRPVDVKLLTGWTTGDLSFADEPLPSVLREMNRYTIHHVRIGDARLNSVRIGGVFHAGDQQSFVLALQTGWSLRAEKDRGGDTILYTR
jgi:transmembrane sensor